MAAEPDLPEDDEPPVAAASVSERQLDASPDHDLVQQLADASRNADSDSDSRERLSGNRMEVCTMLMKIFYESSISCGYFRSGLYSMSILVFHCSTWIAILAYVSMLSESSARKISKFV